MQVKHRRFPRVVHDGERVRVLDEVLHPEVREPGDGDRRRTDIEPPAFPALHRVALPFCSTASMASTRRTALLVSRAVRVAPAIGRMARLISRSSLSDFPRYWRSHC